MPLGFGPLSGDAVGSSPPLATAAALPGGVIVTLAGLGATSALGTVTPHGKVGVTLTGFAMTGRLGAIGGVSTNGSSVSPNVNGFAMTASLGTVTAAAITNVPVDGFGMVASLGDTTYAGTQSAAAPSIFATGEIGIVGAGQYVPWVEVTPSSTPGWVDVVVRIQVQL